MLEDDGVVRATEESHLTILGQTPGSPAEYLGFATPNSGSGADCLSAMQEHLAGVGVSLDSLLCVGCDGTATNTGRSNGAISLLEQQLGRQVQRSVCSLHRIELPFRHLFAALDGTTTGPTSFSGPIGTLAGGNLRKLTPRKFTPLTPSSSFVLSADVVRGLSWDQKQLHRHIQAVCAGELPDKLARSSIGPLCHARWITFQTRLVRLFMCNINSSYYPKLRKLVKYIVDIYFPMHMSIKHKSSIIQGPINLFMELSLIKTCIKGQKDVNTCLEVLKNNCYFAHPHSILLSMLGDPTYSIRKRAIDIINDVRISNINSLSYFLPKFNIDANSYIDMCTMERINGQWKYLDIFDKHVLITEPPLIRNLDLTVYINEPYTSDFSCHTQSVERHVALTTRVTKTVCGRENQSAEGMLVIKGRRLRC